MGSNGVVQGFNMDLARSSSFKTAMEALSSLITRRKRGDGSKRAEKFGLMFKYLKVLGLEEKVDGLKIIHVAGTKGKGSTCVFSEAILRKYGLRTGLFTSPHLSDVTERYRINGLDISKDNFLRYFWDCWDQLKEKSAKDLPMPALFQFLTLLAFKIFLSEKVEVAILEVGLGGRFDSTNVVLKPIVCGITSLGMDHTEILGDTIGEIASEKAGIFKRQVPAFTVPQLSEAMSVLQVMATKLEVPLEVASPIEPYMLNGLKLGLAGDHQLINSGLAIALCRCWLERTGHHEFLKDVHLGASLHEVFLQGLSNAHLLGRAQTIDDMHEDSGDLVFYLDGAHSPESMEVCAKWFAESVNYQYFPKDGRIYHEGPQQSNVPTESKNSHGSSRIAKRVLLFNCMEVRDPNILLPRLIRTCASSGVHFSKALFVPTLSTYHKVDSSASSVPSEACVDISWQFTLQKTWEKLIHGTDTPVHNGSMLQKFDNLPSHGFLHEDYSDNANINGKSSARGAVIASLPLAIKWLRDCAKENPSFQLQVLVTGSLHLVGDVLKLLRR